MKTQLVKANMNARFFVLSIIMSLIAVSGLSVVSAELITDTDSDGSAPEDSYAPDYEEGISTPTWQVGDSWSMGYEMDFDGMDAVFKESLKDSMEGSSSSMDIQFNSCSIGGQYGVYQAATVKDDNVAVTVGDESYSCYQVYFEQYFAMFGNVYVDMKINDDYITVDMTESLDIGLKLDVTGDIYFTKDDLAIVKCIIEQKMDGEIKMNVRGEGDGQKISMKINMQYQDVYGKFTIEYDPPLDFFNFPMESYDSWTAYSSMTVTLTEISGKVSYDISSEIPYSESISESDVIDLGKEIETPDTYHDYVSYNLENSGSDSVTMEDNSKSDCYVIEPRYGYSYDDDYYYDYEESSSSSSFGGSSPFSASDFEADSMTNPVEQMAEAENYYNEDEGYIVSCRMESEDSMGGSSTLPYGSLPNEDEYMVLQPTSYSEVTKFKSTERENMKDENSGSSGGGEDSSLLLMLIAIAVVIIVVVLVIVRIFASKKKRSVRQEGDAAYGQSRYYSTPRSQSQPTQQVQQQYQQPYDKQYQTHDRTYEPAQTHGYTYDPSLQGATYAQNESYPRYPAPPQQPQPQQPSQPSFQPQYSLQTQSQFYQYDQYHPQGQQRRNQGYPPYY